MRHWLNIYFFLSWTAIIACKENNIKQSDSTNAIDTITKASAQIDTFFTVKDTSLYSQHFLDSLKASGYAKTYELIDSFLILDQSDTALFPTDLSLNENIELTGSKGINMFLLTVRQKNYTSLAFDFKIFHAGQIVDRESGEAVLAPLFFLGAESDEDEESGVSYLATEYRKTARGCEFAIRIGLDDDNQLKAKVKRYCSGSIKDIDLNHSPTLTKKRTAS